MDEIFFSKGNRRAENQRGREPRLRCSTSNSTTAASANVNHWKAYARWRAGGIEEKSSVCTRTNTEAGSGSSASTRRYRVPARHPPSENRSAAAARTGLADSLRQSAARAAVALARCRRRVKNPCPPAAAWSYRAARAAQKLLRRRARHGWGCPADKCDRSDNDRSPARAESRPAAAYRRPWRSPARAQWPMRHTDAEAHP
jgi:hypothetical protein